MEDEPLGEPLLVVPVAAVGGREEGVAVGGAVQVDVAAGGEEPEEVAGELPVRVEKAGGGDRGHARDDGDRAPASRGGRSRGGAPAGGAAAWGGPTSIRGAPPGGRHACATGPAVV